jgi:hypothetical protein
MDDETAVRYLTVYLLANTPKPKHLGRISRGFYRERPEAKFPAHAHQDMVLVDNHQPEAPLACILLQVDPQFLIQLLLIRRKRDAMLGRPGRSLNLVALVVARVVPVEAKGCH